MDDRNGIIQEIRERIARIETKLDLYNSSLIKIEELAKAIITAQGDIKENKNTIEGIEEGHRWLRRAFWGTLIAIAIGLIFNSLTLKF